MVDGAAADLLVGAAKGPESAALLVDTILTAATRFFVLNTLLLVLLLPVRTGARGPEILTVVLIRAERPGKEKEAELISVLVLQLAALLLLLLLLLLETPPAVSAAWARKLVTGMLGAVFQKLGNRAGLIRIVVAEVPPNLYVLHVYVFRREGQVRLGTVRYCTTPCCTPS